ncbi:cupin domain-containing protein [Pelagibacterium sp. 26DY04]|uniref:cupin domain-containing protein n=1 Tax=Pelagibacterium sp. 26DY04 TaxID=2967130 RepID=UPI0028150DE7|nr:cupin domain-containing protein [Pelagibacterium sp. 26DY04]WMT85932.1 cupin domain-containing protein [Pelagibacterium sp. 26DY04]
MPTSGSFLKGADAQWKGVGEGRRMQMLCYNDQLMMLRWEFARGAVGAPHTHPHTQTAYIESGVFDVTIDGVTERLGAGSSYVVDGGVLHGAVCIEAGTMVDAFTPMREDYV